MPHDLIFCLGLICVDPLSRLCPEEALQHKWIEETARVVTMAHCTHDESRSQPSDEVDVTSGTGNTQSTRGVLP